MAPTFSTRVMGADTPQQNQLIKLGFTSVSAQAWAMLSRAHLPIQTQYLLCRKALCNATHLSNLQVVKRDGNMLTRYEPFYGETPKYATQLQGFGETGPVKMGKDGKLGNHGIPMIFVGYALDHSQDCYCMYNPNTQWIRITRDIKWLH